MSWDLVALQGVWLTAPRPVPAGPFPIPGAAPGRPRPVRRLVRLEGEPVRYRAFAAGGRPWAALAVRGVAVTPAVTVRSRLVVRARLRGRLWRAPWGAGPGGRWVVRRPALERALLGLGEVAEVLG